MGHFVEPRTEGKVENSNIVKEIPFNADQLDGKISMIDAVGDKRHDVFRTSIELFNLADSRTTVSIHSVSIIALLIDHSSVTTNVDAQSIFDHEVRKTLALGAGDI